MKDIGKSALKGSAIGNAVLPGIGTAVGGMIGAVSGLFRTTNFYALDAEHFFDAMSKALNEDFEYHGKMALGMVTSGHIGTSEPDQSRLETVTKLGELDNRMSTSFPSLTNQIQVQGDRITKIMDEIGKSDSDLVDLTNQLKDCNLKTLRISDEIGELDSASEGISSHLIEIGKLAKSV